MLFEFEFKFILKHLLYILGFFSNTITEKKQKQECHDTLNRSNENAIYMYYY